MEIHEFQQLMRRLYFQRDHDRGPAGTFKWFTDEVEELGDALETGDLGGVQEEFADVLAWLTSLANITGIDLEKVALKKYDNKCPKCGHSPCECTF